MYRDTNWNKGFCELYHSLKLDWQMKIKIDERKYFA